ncbi:molybdopterin-binding protein [Chloroflexota bacterium]
MEISARNLLKGKIKQVIPGAVNTEVIIELTKDIELVSIITRASADKLRLAVGKEAYAIVKASNVIIGIE